MLHVAHEGMPAMYSCSSNGPMPGHSGEGDAWLDSPPRLSLVKLPIPMFTVLARALPVVPRLAR